MAKVKLLFICTANINRSRTAEDMLAGSDKYEVKSAGLVMLKDSGQVITQKLVDEADQIFVMNEIHDKHRTKLMERFETWGKDVFDLNIRDIYARGEKELVRLLRLRFEEFGIEFENVSVDAAQNEFPQDSAGEICQKFQNDFLSFIDQGEASQDFLVHLDSCPKCQETIEKEFERITIAFENLARYLKNKKR